MVESTLGGDGDSFLIRQQGDQIPALSQHRFLFRHVGDVINITGAPQRQFPAGRSLLVDGKKLPDLPEHLVGLRMIQDFAVLIDQNAITFVPHADEFQQLPDTVETHFTPHHCQHLVARPDRLVDRDRNRIPSCPPIVEYRQGDLLFASNGLAEPFGAVPQETGLLIRGIQDNSVDINQRNTGENAVDLFETLKLLNLPLPALLGILCIRKHRIAADGIQVGLGRKHDPMKPAGKFSTQGLLLLMFRHQCVPLGQGDIRDEGDQNRKQTNAKQGGKKALADGIHQEERDFSRGASQLVRGASCGVTPGSDGSDSSFDTWPERASQAS